MFNFSSVAYVSIRHGCFIFIFFDEVWNRQTFCSNMYGQWSALHCRWSALHYFSSSHSAFSYIWIPSERTLEKKERLQYLHWIGRSCTNREKLLHTLPAAVQRCLWMKLSALRHSGQSSESSACASLQETQSHASRTLTSAPSALQVTSDSSAGSLTFFPRAGL